MLDILMLLKPPLVKPLLMQPCQALHSLMQLLLDWQQLRLKLPLRIHNQ
jgi:hypothetical protein